MEDKKLRIALVNQRYGEEVNGGSEYYTKRLAEHLKMLYDVEVLTTKAMDYMTWEDYYDKDIENINGVTVRRFSVAHKRNLFGMKLYWRIPYHIPFGKAFWEERWMDAQGPYCPDLIHYIETHKDDYAVIIFVTYLYYQTVRGVPAAADRAILLPTAHDEPYIYMDIFKRLFQTAKGIIYLTPEEKTFVEEHFSLSGKPNCVTGAGVDLPESIDNIRFREKYNIQSEYLIYVGRIEPSKGCKEMFRIFDKYKRLHPDNPVKLVLLGKSIMDIPEREDIISLGFVSEEDKFDGISGAEALWLPSQFESLSIVVLEAMSLGVPVIVNGKCEVLKGHCQRSGAGFWYQNAEEAIHAIDTVLNNIRRESIYEKAKHYIEEKYKWEIIIEKIDRLIRDIASSCKI